MRYKTLLRKHETKRDMTPEQFKSLKDKFSDYTDKYIREYPNPAPLILKKDHTMRVCDEIEELVNSVLGNSNKTLLNSNNILHNKQHKTISISPESVLLARSMALFHDIGRFRQFETYGTFLDHKSVNHAALSIIEIDIHNMLDICSEREKALIKGAIAVHNAASVPQIEDKEMLFFMQALRDADKLDIWRVVINNYTAPDAQSQDIVNLGLQDRGGCSCEALSAILNNTYVKINSIRELNDLKLMQISWVFDLNFQQSVKKVQERGYIEQIVSTLSAPQYFDGLANALECVYGYIKTNSY